MVFHRNPGSPGRPGRWRRFMFEPLAGTVLGNPVLAGLAAFAVTSTALAAVGWFARSAFGSAKTGRQSAIGTSIGCAGLSCRDRPASGGTRGVASRTATSASPDRKRRRARGVQRTLISKRCSANWTRPSRRYGRARETLTSNGLPRARGSPVRGSRQGEEVQRVSSIRRLVRV